jgi:Family of unknown function (DUF6535)
MEGIIIFVRIPVLCAACRRADDRFQSGLFAAVITAFIIDGYKKLSLDSGSVTVDLLAHISQQLAGASNGSHIPALVPRQSFQPTHATVRINVVWFLSLTLGLTCTLSATLVQQWSRNYIQVINRRRAPHTKGRYQIDKNL